MIIKMVMIKISKTVNRLQIFKLAKEEKKKGKAAKYMLNYRNQLI